MEALNFFVDLFLNLDTVLGTWVSTYGGWVYAMLFLIIFCETGLVVMAVLPGDSLLFTAGALAAITGPDGEPLLNIWLLLVLLFTAAVLGDGTNYLIGRFFGQRILDSGKFPRIIKPRYIDDTNAFFAKHGGKTISLARFFPFIRTFAPFMAGIGGMDWKRFTFFNVTGGAAWVSLFLGAGYFFGNIPVVKHNLEYLVIGIIVVSVAPTAYHAIKSRTKKPAEQVEAGE
ncbi:MAG: DedA family protein [Coriobacteriia bacterium]|nr:DedA family protein [Coriobacteriia bacterium]